MLAPSTLVSITLHVRPAISIHLNFLYLNTKTEIEGDLFFKNLHVGSRSICEVMPVYCLVRDNCIKALYHGVWPALGRIAAYQMSFIHPQSDGPDLA